MRSDWTYVTNSKRKQSVRKCAQSVLLSGNDGIRSFLSTFKTRCCIEIGLHDYRKCQYYHSDKDKRRDPYTIMYLPDDEDTSITESVYHPMNFLTRICEQSSNCPYGRYCAKAHDKSLVRDIDGSRIEYSNHWSNMPLENAMISKPSLGAYIPGLQKDLALKTSISQASPRWNVDGHKLLPKYSEYLFEIPLDSKSWFLINSSDKFFHFLQDITMREGLAQIEIRNNHWGEGAYGIAVRGSKYAQGRAIEELDTYLKDPPLDFFVQKSKTLTTRVIKILREQTQSEILGSFALHAFIEFSKEDEIIICASNQSNRGDQIICQVLEKLSFWIKQEGHDKFVDCSCCLDSFNLDQGLACKNGHFYCGGNDGCIGAMVKEQLQRMQHQDGAIACSICHETIDTRSLALHLSKETWLTLEDARIDSKVKLQVEELSHEFDKRLDVKIHEFIQEYGSVSGMVKHEAKKIAKQAQDDIMNLKCPHCKAPYAEFDGCMAIQCGSCKRYFCGYCHNGFDSGRGAHDHVRQCLVNETSNGSYYATPEQIKIAQRKHRTRELKKLLQTLKKDIKNATVIELEEDLAFHGIEKAALFEFGNLLIDI